MTVFTSYAASLTGTLSWGSSQILCMDSAPTNSDITLGGGTANINQILLNNLSAVSQSGLQINGLAVRMISGSPGVVGNLAAVAPTLNLNAKSGNANANYIGMQPTATATVNDNGTGGTPAGALFGLNSNAFLQSGATFWRQVIGQEVDVAASSGSSVADVIGMQIVETSIGTVAGSRSNLGLSLNNATGAVGFDVGICFGAFSGFNPITAGGTLIGTMQHAVSLGYGVSGSMGTVAYGIDITGYTFTGAPMVAQLQTPASSSAAGKTGSICWDANFIYICTATNTWKRATLSTF